MSQELANHYVTQFAGNVLLLAQQMGSKLRPYVDVGMDHKGEKASPVDQIGSVEMQEVTGRFQDIGRVDASVTRRWVMPSDADLNQIVDPHDELRLITDPKAKYSLNAGYAAGRRFDRQILAAINGSSYIGKNGTSTLALPSGQKVAINHESAGSSGLTVAKLIEARRILMAGNVDLDDPRNKAVCAITAKQSADLIKEAQVQSKDFNVKPVLVDGKVTHFMGFDFVHTELLETSNTTITQVPVFCKSGVHLGIWRDMTTDISRRNDLKGIPWQCYVYLTSGATRVEEAKVVQISCLNV